MVMHTSINSAVDPVLPTLRQLLLVFVFGGVLSIAFLDSSHYYFTWFAFVPLLFAVENAGAIKTYLLGVLAGLVSYVSGMYWIVDFIIISKGFGLGKSIVLASVYWFYCAHLIALLLLLYRWLKQRTNIHEFVLFPVVLTTFTSTFPMLFAMRLGESQTHFQSALQAIEFTGVHGLDLIIALFNIVVFRLLARRSAHLNATHSSIWPWLIAMSLIALWLIYGVLQYSAWQNRVSTWPVLKTGIVQPNEVPSLDKTIIYSGYSYAYPPEMDITERLSSLGAEIIIWPEAQPKGYLDNSHIRTAFQHAVKGLGISLIFQDMSYHRDPINGKLQSQTNTAIMINNFGEQQDPYIKMKRIPFGEYVPFSGEDSLLQTSVKNIFGDFLIETTKGQSHQLFAHQKLNIIPLICYETTSPSFVSEAVNKTRPLANTSNASLIVALSNDGWFGSTHQPFQHIMPSILRAVENRLPLVHVANNGPSIVASPSGDVLFSSAFQSSAGYITDVPYSATTQGSFYSRHPKLFDNLLRLLMLIAIFSAIRTMLISRRQANI